MKRKARDFWRRSDIQPWPGVVAQMWTWQSMTMCAADEFTWSCDACVASRGERRSVDKCHPEELATRDLGVERHCLTPRSLSRCRSIGMTSSAGVRLPREPTQASQLQAAHRPVTSRYLAYAVSQALPSF